VNRYTLTRIAHAPRLSEETPAFAAVLCEDGRAIADVTNDGRGGCNLVRPRNGCHDAVARAEQWAKSLPSRTYSWGVVESDLESWVMERVEHEALVKQYRRSVRAKVLVRDDKGTLREFRWTGLRAITPQHVATIAAKHPTWTVLNTLTEAEAIAILEATTTH